MCSSPRFYQQLACSRLLLQLETLCTSKSSVGPHPTIEALFESKDSREAHNKEGNDIISTESPCLVIGSESYKDRMKYSETKDS